MSLLLLFRPRLAPGGTGAVTPIPLPLTTVAPGTLTLTPLPPG